MIDTEKLKIPESLEALIILEGENTQEKPRCKKAVEVYQAYGRLPIIVSGSHSGLWSIQLPLGTQPISHAMRNWLLKQGIRGGDIAVEDKSMDTVANFYFTRQSGLLGNYKRIGVDTDIVHLPRSLWCAEKVFGKLAEFVSVPSGWPLKLSMKVQESIKRDALKYDLRNMIDGDFSALTEYIQYTDPFHARAYGNIPKTSWFGLLAKWASVKNGEKMILEAIKNYSI